MVENIYIVDDDEISIFLAETVLETYGFTGNITSFLDSEVGLKTIIATEINKLSGDFIIFLDLNMPRINGWEFLDKINEHNPEFFGRCHVVILSSAIDGQEILKSNEYPLVLSFVPKPLDETALGLIMDLVETHKTD